MKKSILFTIVLSFFSIVLESQILDGYTDKVSYRAGDSVAFYLNGKSKQGGNLPLSIVGNHSSGGISIAGFTNVILQQPTNSEPWKNGFGYAQTPIQNSTNNKWLVPGLAVLPSGYYLLDGKVPFIVKGDKINSDIVIVCPTNTINAYTVSGGKSLYNDCVTNYPNCTWTGVPATTVSFQRPQDYKQGLMDAFLEWIHNTEYKVNVISDADMDDYSEIENAKLLIVIGHSEYWTRQARLNFDQFVDGGKNALILSGNTMWWQVRYTPDKNKMSCYRSLTADGDNVYNATQDPLLKTIEWAQPTLNYSILKSIGAQWGLGASPSHGGYGIEGSSQTKIKGSKTHYACDYGGFYGHKIILPNSPIFEGVNMKKGKILYLANGEYDGSVFSNLDYRGNIIGRVPILDTAALGFYKANLIGYDVTVGTIFENDITRQRKNYCPLMAFQKTLHSGVIINVNSNEWCGELGMGGKPFKSATCKNSLVEPHPRLKHITKNMIDLLLLGKDVFVDPVNETEEEEILQIYPNPTIGLINLSIDENSITKVCVRDITGLVLMESYEKSSKLDLSSLVSGCYFIEVFHNNKTSVGKVILVN